jgi:hypothetical protein
MIVAIVFVVLIALGMPIGFVLGAAGIAGLIQMGGTGFLHLTPAKVFHGLNIFPFLAMPFFILAGEIMNHTGITARLVGLARVLVGHLRGGLAQTNMVVFSTGWPAEGSWPDISTVQLLQNNGDGSFVDVTDDLLEGYNIDSNSSYATVFADFNDDGWVDMLVSDSDWNTPNTSTSFILSNGDGTFSEQGRDIITSLNDASSGMGTALQDSEGQVYLILAEQFIYQGNSFSDPTFETITAYPVDFL